MSLPTSKFYTTKEVAAMEGVTEDYLRKLVAKGEFLQPSRPGKPHRWLKTIIDQHYADLDDSLKQSA